ncbi:hypothetical protein [Gluconobacter sp.]|uniref:hypothetical protein n=1 Tax=Gluconobacter sp. TaxID=1876758 RepID=UPI0039E903DE
MSHVTTSASLMTTGPGRGELAPGTQLASNERFHDFLESYVHPKTPAHAQVSQKNTMDKPQALKAQGSDSKSSNQLPKTRAPTKFDRSAATQNEATDSNRHIIATKSNIVAKDMPSDRVQKNTLGLNREQNQKNGLNQFQQEVKGKEAGKIEKIKNNDEQNVEKEIPEDGLSELPDNNSVVQSSSDVNISEGGQATPALESQEQEAEPKPSDSTDLSLEHVSVEVSAQKDRASQITTESLPVMESVDGSKPVMSMENIPLAHMESTPEKTISAEPVDETSFASQSEKASEAADSEERISRHDEQQPLLYQKIDGGNATTHIEMSIGNHEKVHVEIGGDANKEHRIHINTDNPEVYQSLKDDRDTLLATITQNSVSMTDLQPLISPDIQVSLSAPSFLDMSSNGKRQEENNQSSGATRGASTANASPVAERRVLRGVVDLTV